MAYHACTPRALPGATWLGALVHKSSIRSVLDVTDLPLHFGQGIMMTDRALPTYTQSSPSPHLETDIEPPSYDAHTNTRLSPPLHVPNTTHTYTLTPKPNVELTLILNTSYAPSVTSTASSSVAPRQYIPLYYIGVGNVGGEFILDLKKGICVRGIYVSVSSQVRSWARILVTIWYL